MDFSWESKKKEWFKNYYKNNKERFLAKSHLQYKKKKEENKNYCKDYYNDNKEKLKSYCKKYHKKKTDERKKKNMFKKTAKNIILTFD